MRFQLLNYEPYLTVLTCPDITFRIYYKDTLTVRDFLYEILPIIKEKYKEESIDYINYIVTERVNEAFHNRKINLKDYINFFKSSLDKITDDIIEGLTIKRLEEFKFITLYIEPSIVLVEKLISEGFQEVLFKKNFYRLIDYFLEKKYPYIDLHVHAETSYVFSSLLETLISNYHLVFSEFIKYEKSREKTLKDFIKVNVLAETFCNLKKGKKGSEILSSIRFRLNTKIPKKVYDIHILKDFKYNEFILQLLNSIHSQRDLDLAISSILNLQIINEINSSLAFTGEYKGLKQMQVNFSHTLKKVYQKTRTRIFKDSDQLIKENFRPFKDKNDSYIEVRLSPEGEALKYWHKKLYTPDRNHKSVFFIVHYKKFDSPKDFQGFEGLKNFILEQNKATKELFSFLKREKEIAELIVGFDAASIEYWTPPWIYRVLFKFWELFFKLKFNREIIFTYHAGEDFIDLVSGLKQVYEARYFLKVHRLGHAMALGVNVERYIYRYQRVIIRPIFYFYHLLWLYHMTTNFEKLTSYKSHVLNELDRFIERYELNEVVRQYNVSITIDVFFKNLYESLGFFDFLFLKSFVNREFSKILKEAHRLVFPEIEKAHAFSKIALNIHKLLSNRRNEFEEINPVFSSKVKDDVQLEFLTALQSVIKDFIKKEKVVIEVCPSSNVILYNIKSFRDHPLLFDNDGLILTVNTDNPLLLNTNIQLEYAILDKVMGSSKKLKELVENAKASKGKDFCIL